MYPFIIQLKVPVPDRALVILRDDLESRLPKDTPVIILPDFVMHTECTSPISNWYKYD